VLLTVTTAEGAGAAAADMLDAEGEFREKERAGEAS